MRRPIAFEADQMEQWVTKHSVPVRSTTKVWARVPFGQHHGPETEASSANRPSSRLKLRSKPMMTRRSP